MARNPFRALTFFRKLFFRNRLYGTARSARAATDALFGVDIVLRIALTYRSDGAGFRARSARNTRIADFVCHFYTPPIKFCLIIVAQNFRFCNTVRKIFALFFIPLYSSKFSSSASSFLLAQSSQLLR